jgi:integrase
MAMTLMSPKLHTYGPGKHHDERGLYLQVTSGARKDAQGHPVLTRSWLVRYMLNGKAHDLGLGAVRLPADKDPRHVTLAEARDKRDEVRALLRDGTDPIAVFSKKAKRQAEQAAKLAEAKALTFKAYPIIGDLPVRDIDTAAVLSVLKPIWNEKTVTASRLQGRIERILAYAKVNGYRAGDNPALWKGHLQEALPRPGKVRKVKHHPALHYDDLPAFFAALQKAEGIPSRALEYLVLTACRRGDMTGNPKDQKPGARWDQINWQDNIWTIPSTKTDTEHKVPLSSAAVALLTKMQEAKLSDEYPFPGANRSAPISYSAMRDALLAVGDWQDKKTGEPITIHGFRSTFRTWAEERTSYSDLAKVALAHTISDKVDAAYQRGDLLEKRRKLMEAWARFCTSGAATTGKVVSIRKAASP